MKYYAVLGHQATVKQIAFKKLTSWGRNDLWAVDNSKTAYRYTKGNWQPLMPGNDAYQIMASVSGVIITSPGNDLQVRDGISTENPLGTQWRTLLASEFCCDLLLIFSMQVICSQCK